MHLKRPILIWIIACLYLVVGSIGFVGHFRDFRQPDGIWIELTEFLAVLAGVFILLRRNWARWLALLWIAFHVVLSAFHTLRELTIHSLFVMIAWILFRPAAKEYFHTEATH
jgi:uncharacterized membrane protein HdeD (DUF308 family)